MSRKRRILRDVVVVALILFGIGLWQTKDLVPSGEPAPAVTAPLLGGEAFDLAALKGRPVLLYFFAPWCSVCKVSASNAAWIRKWLPTNIEVAAVALDYETEESIAAFVRDAGIESLPVVKGTDDIRDRYKVAAYPTYYVVDAEGRIKSRSVGYSTFLGMLLRL